MKWDEIPTVPGAFERMDQTTKAELSHYRRFRHGIAVLLGGLLLTFIGCGAPPDATGDWSGRIEVGGGEAAGEVETADLSLSLNQSESGAVSGNGELVIDAQGEVTRVGFETVTGRLDEDGNLSITAKNEELLRQTELDMDGTVGGNSMEGNADLNADGILAEPVTASGNFELEKEE